MSHPAATPSPVPAPDRITRESDRVRFWEKAALGLGFLPLFFGFSGVKSLTIPVYQMTLKLDPMLLGLALAVSLLWDAMMDPFVGVKSDNSRFAWGRRKPFVFFGAITQAVAFGLIWMVPSNWGQTGTLIYLMVTLVLFYSCFSVFSVPMMSLTYEMTPDYQERTRVSAFGGFFGKVGEVMYNYVFPLASNVALFGSVIAGVRWVGWGVGILILGVCGVVPAFFVKERFKQQVEKQAKVKFLPSLRDSFQNRAFVVLVALTICQIVAGMFASSIDYYLIVYNMFGGDVGLGSWWKGYLSTGYAIVGIAGIFPLRWLANKYGKRATLIGSFVLVGIGTAGKWLLFTPGHPWKILIDPLFCGPVWIAINVLTPSMFADICDDDELKHGQRREGTFGSIFSWIQKTGYSLSFFGTGVALNLAGFDAKLEGAQHPDAILNMRLILTLSTAAWAVIAIAILYFYPIDSERAYATRDALEARRGRV